jgi:hypothetical protein
MNRRAAYLGLAIGVALMATALIGSYQEVNAQERSLPAHCSGGVCVIPLEAINELVKAHNDLIDENAALEEKLKGCFTLKKERDS